MGSWMWIQQRIWPGRESYLVSLRLCGLPAFVRITFSTDLFQKVGTFFSPQITALIHHDLPRIHHVVSIQKPRFCTAISQNHPRKPSSKKISLKSEKKFFEEVGGYGGAIFRGAADVVDRTDFGEDGGPGGRDVVRGNGVAGQGFLGGGRAGGGFAHACSADAYVFDASLVHAGEDGDGYLGDGLCVASAHLADVRFVTFIVT